MGRQKSRPGADGLLCGGTMHGAGRGRGYRLGRQKSRPGADGLHKSLFIRDLQTEATGFEPVIPLRALRFSRPVQSTALPRLPIPHLQFNPWHAAVKTLGQATAAAERQQSRFGTLACFRSAAEACSRTSALSTLQIRFILLPQADGCFTPPHRWSNLIRRRSLPLTRGCGAEANL